MESSDDLLREVINASNRTTRAVRAFVRFLFIQLTFATIACLAFLIGIATQTLFWSLIAAFALIAGLIWSSIAGWDELAKSDPRPIKKGFKACIDCSAEIEIDEQICGACGAKQWKL